ncbi:ABC transporter substrate-binding protein [Variovorax sp. RCC_210]|uniref:ABC transporter substrate-binding protein n=1 Tax=Variovorax sp. RCC_210 TaxID=3239217 RepID=UPI003525DAD3
MPRFTLRRAALAAVPAACLAASAAFAQTTVTVAQPADIRSTNPGVNRDNTTDGVLLNVVEGLVGYRADGSVGPLLAQSVDVSADGLTYTFKLRKGVKFHNDAPLTAADVAWNWKRYMDPKTDWRCTSEYDGRNGLKVVDTATPDDATFVMKINKPSAVFLDTLARTDCGMTAILHKSSLKADGSWDKPVGTGPFKFGEWKRGEYVTLTAFKGYTSSPGATRSDGYTGLKAPLVDTVRFLVVPDAATAAAGLKSGAIDAGQITSSDAQELKTDRSLTVQAPPEAIKNVLLIQTRDPLLKNQKLRQAIAASLDIEQIVAAASEGLGAVNNSAIHKGSAFYSAAQKKGWHYDPAQAAKLLREAGYKGEKITIQTNKRAHVPSYTVAVLAQAMMQAVGINAQIEVLEWATQLDRYNSGNYQMSSFSYSSRLDPALSYEQFSGPKDKQARKVWEDPQALKLIDDSFTEADPKKRQVLFDQIHAQMIQQVPMVMLFNGIDAWAVRKRVSGFAVWEGKPRLWGVSVTATRG